MVYATAAAMIAGVGEWLGSYVPPSDAVKRDEPTRSPAGDKFLDDVSLEW